MKIDPPKGTHGIVVWEASSLRSKPERRFSISRQLSPRIVTTVLWCRILEVLHSMRNTETDGISVTLSGVINLMRGREGGVVFLRAGVALGSKYTSEQCVIGALLKELYWCPSPLILCVYICSKLDQRLD